MDRVPLPNTAAVQSVGTAAGTTAATAAGPSMAVDMLRSDLHVAEKLLARSKRKGAAQYTEADRDRILERSALGLQPSTIQAEWGAHAPGLDYIHGVVNNERRRTRLNLPPYEAMHELCQRDNGKRVMLYLVADPDLDPRHRSSSSVPLAALHLVMCADIDMVDSIIMAVGLGIDTKWRTCEGGGCVIGIGAHQRHTTAKQREGRRVEFDAGYVHHQYSVVAIALSNLDNYWALLSMLCALRGLLPCTDPNCAHALRRVSLDSRGSFVMQRACFPLRAHWMTGFSPQQSFVWRHGRPGQRMLAMIDKCGFERRACEDCGLQVVLCDFHAFAAQLEYFDKTLGIRDKQVLYMLIVFAKYLARSLTEDILARRRVVVERLALPALGLGMQLHQKIVDYWRKEWLSEPWKSTWMDLGRHSDDDELAFMLRIFPRTNNAQERVWITYLGPAVCNWMMFKRKDFEFNAVTNALGNRRTCMIDILALIRRDYPNRRTRIATPVHNVCVLGLAIVAQKGVIGGPPGFVYVRKGLSPRAILNFGSHKATKLPDIWLPQRHKPASEAMQAQIRKELCALNVSHRDGYEIYNVRTRQCTCWSFTYTGQLCKHAAAYNLSHLRSGSTCSAEEAAQ
jgi:hypothetical protein